VSAQLKGLSQERLPGRQRQKAHNWLQATLRIGRDRTSPISTRKSPEVRDLRDGIRDFGDYVECVVADAVVVEPVSSLQFADLQGDFDKMQGEPIQFLVESHCAVRGWKDFSLSKKQGEASRIAGKSRVAKGPDTCRVR
jgi:hypothetical protein